MHLQSAGTRHRFAFASTLPSRTRAPRGVMGPPGVGRHGDRAWGIRRDLLFAFAGRPVFAYVAAGASSSHRARPGFVAAGLPLTTFHFDLPATSHSSLATRSQPSLTLFYLGRLSPT